MNGDRLGVNEFVPPDHYREQYLVVGGERITVGSSSWLRESDGAWQPTDEPAVPSDVWRVLDAQGFDKISPPQ